MFAPSGCDVFCGKHTHALHTHRRGGLTGLPLLLGCEVKSNFNEFHYSLSSSVASLEKHGPQSTTIDLSSLFAYNTMYSFISTYDGITFWLTHQKLGGEKKT